MSDIELTKVSVKSFKKIKKLEIDIEPLNLIIGGNNSGKSSLLQAIHTAVSSAQTQVEQGGLKAFAEETLRYSPGADFSALGHNTPFGNRSDQNRATVEFSATDTIEDETRSLQYTVQLYKGRNPRVVGVDRIGDARLGSLIANLAKPFSIYVPGLAGIPHFEEYKTAPVVLRKIAGGEANLVLRNIIWQIKINGKLNELISRLREFFPELDIQIEYIENTDTNITIKVRTSLRESFNSIELCGTGILQAVQIFSYVVLFKPTLLLLDEPDSHLHPSNQIKLIDAMEFLNSTYGTKVIIATHSRHLMSAAQSNGNFYWLDNGVKKENGEFELANALMDLGGLDEVDKVLNSRKDFLFFIEDKNKKTFKILLDSCNLPEKKYDIVSYHGVSNADATATIINSLRPFIKGDAQIIVHRDRDFRKDNELTTFKKNFENKGIKVFITDESDIEHYFINNKHIKDITGLDDNEVSAFIKECLEESKIEIRKSFQRKRQEINREKMYKDGGAPQSSDLFPTNASPELKHVVGKDFCKILSTKAQNNNLPNCNIIVKSSICLAPDLLQLLNLTVKPQNS